MLDKRLWPNLIYTFLILLMCITLWQMVTSPADPPLSSTPLGAFSVYSSNSSTFTYPISSLPPGDYHRLIDLFNFTFTMLNFPCNDTPFLVVLVHSSPSNFQRRTTIRSTWGRNTAQMRVLFMLGQVGNDTELQQRLQDENERHSDLVQGSFRDAYRNMTYKHVMLLKYVVYHCPQAKYVLKIDDDVFVHTPLLLNFLAGDLSPHGSARMLFCSLRKGSLVMRGWRSKWRVSVKEYPNRTYPPYCPGWAIVYSPDVVFELYRLAQQTDYFWVDDVHLTGTLAEKMHLSHVNIDKVTLTRSELKNGEYRKAGFNRTFLFSPPDIAQEDVKSLWEYVETHETPQSVLKHVVLV